MRMWNEYQETTDLLNELEANEIEYTLAEQNKVYVDVTNDDELEGIFQIQYEPYWDAFKMTYFVLEDNEIRGDKTVAWDIQQVIEAILG